VTVASAVEASTRAEGEVTPRIRWRLLGLQQQLSYALRRGDLDRAHEVASDLRQVLDELRPLRPAA
jgi:hypothetical protein